MSREERSAYFSMTQLVPLTSKTATQPSQLHALCQAVVEEGYAIIDEELEPGLRSIAVPVKGLSGSTVAAVNVGTQAARVSTTELRTRYFPALKRCARDLTAMMTLA